jgi:hypothetical protein
MAIVLLFLLNLTFAFTPEELELAHKAVSIAIAKKTTPLEKFLTSVNENPLLKTKLEKMIYAYASCFPLVDGKFLNWQVLKSIAWAESKFNMDAGVCLGKKANKPRGSFFKDESTPPQKVVNRCKTEYKGLFQINEDYCREAFNGREVPKTYEHYCRVDRQDPDTNIFSATSQLQRYFDLIQASCQNLCLEDGITMIYTGHNDGFGVLRNHLLDLDAKTPKAACNKKDIEESLKKYYRRKSKLSVKKGMLKLKTSQETILPFAEQMGTKIITISIPEDIRKVSCPLKLGKKIFDLL